MSKEENKSKLRTLSQKQFNYQLKREITWFVLIILALIRKSLKFKNNSWSTLLCISKSHGKTRKTNSCTMTFKPKSITKTNISTCLLKNCWPLSKPSLNLMKRLNKKWQPLKMRVWGIIRLRDGRLRSLTNSFCQMKSLRSLFKCLRTLESSSSRSWFRTFCISKAKEKHKWTWKVIFNLILGKASIDWKNVKKNLINKDLFNNVLAYVIE